MGDPPDLGDAAPGLRLELAEHLLSARGVAGEEVARRVQAERDAGQRWPQAVMKVAADAPAFLFAGGDEAFAGADEVAEQQRRSRRHRRLPGKIIQQPSFAATEP